ncbi:YwqG family protein [Gorillibacterium sp. sgz500922]|uniref:YwqG family protein n=1 Tax=Gorillibacterium sp. sgz500922 TaxID=3446694 RepID=UPI003F67ECBB
MVRETHTDKLERLVREYQFEHAMEYLQASVRQGIRLSKKEIETYSEIGASRIGGDPDLPAGMEWPADSAGTSMTFLAQLRLSDLLPHDDTNRLPATGMLYFFVGLDEPAYGIEHKVIYLSEDKLQETKRHPSPEVTAVEGEFTGYRVSARSSLEPPNYGYVDVEIVEDDEHDYDLYEELCFELTEKSSNDLAVMFGYPSTQHGDCEYEAALHLLTGKTYTYSMEAALQQITDHFKGDSDRAKQEVGDMMLLLALDSDPDVGFCWWDAGELQFFIRKEDLLAGNFANTYCSLYSS